VAEQCSARFRCEDRRVSEAEVQVVAQAGQAYQERGVDGLLEFAHPEIEWRTRADLPDSDLYEGHDGVRRLYARFEEDLEGMYYEPEELIDIGDDRVLMVFRWGGTGRASGVQAEVQGEAWVMKIVGDKVVRVDEFANKQEALEAAGVAGQ
jgi:ketosteroid isomerase-like protein